MRGAWEKSLVVDFNSPSRASVTPPRLLLPLRSGFRGLITCTDDQQNLCRIWLLFKDTASGILSLYGHVAVEQNMQ